MRDIATASTTHQVLMLLVIIPLGTALFEETIFRGVLLGVLLRAYTAASRCRRELGRCSGSGTSSRRSAARTERAAPRPWAPSSGRLRSRPVAGVLFAWLRLRSGSLAAPVLAHIATNSLAYLAAIIVVQR